jgi:hypothetical protein
VQTNGVMLIITADGYRCRCPCPTGSSQKGLPLLTGLVFPLDRQIRSEVADCLKQDLPGVTAFGSSTTPLPRRLMTTSSPSNRHCLGRPTAWLLPLTKSFAVGMAGSLIRSRCAEYIRQDAVTNLPTATAFARDGTGRPVAALTTSANTVVPAQAGTGGGTVTMPACAGIPDIPSAAGRGQPQTFRAGQMPLRHRMPISTPDQA